MKKKKDFLSYLPIIMIVAGCICLVYALYCGYRWLNPAPLDFSSGSSASASVSSGTPSPTIQPSSDDPTATYPEGKLFVTSGRARYESGTMFLTVERLGLQEIPVLGDVTEETLKHGVGLYDYSQTPGTGNRNVSIAGHRDIYNMEFYQIDKLTDGDLMVLTYEGKRYTYLYRDTKIVEEDDWSPIYIQGFSCLTLTSCHPIAVASHRMIVRAELQSIEDVAAPPVAASESAASVNLAEPASVPASSAVAS